VKCPLILSGHLWKHRLGSFGTGVGFGSKGQIPGQQLADAADVVVGDLGEHRPQVEFRVEAVELGRADEAVERGGTISACVGAGEQVILAAESHGAECSFGRAVVYLQLAIVDVAREGTPA